MNSVYQNYYDRFLLELRIAGMSSCTLDNYGFAIRLFLGSIHYDPAEMPINKIKNYIDAILSRYAAKTHNLHIAALKTYFNLVHGRNDVAASLPRTKEDKFLPWVLSKEQIQAIIDGERNLKHKAILMLAYGCGLRLGEIHSLLVGYVGFDEEMIYPCGKGRKQRQVPMPENLKPILPKFCMHRDISQFVFLSDFSGGQLTERTIQKIFENACERVGVQRQGGIHSLRHSYATHLLDAGVSLRIIQELLGHSSSKTTEIYTHVSTQCLNNVKSPLDYLHVAVG